ncbi:MAG: hypothetical protein ACUVTZ_14675 [Armatimonadota bacterium]
MIRKRLVKWIAVTAVICVGATAARVHSIDLGDVLKVGGIGYVVRQSAGALNRAINTLTMNKGLESELHTKVVPILSIGQGGYIGAAQVAGPEDAVKKVEAVGQLEAGFNFGARFRAKVLVPIDTNDPRKGFHRVPGVGVSAVIDIRL